MPIIMTLTSSILAGTSRSLGHRGSSVTSIISLTLSYLSSLLIWVDQYLGTGGVLVPLGTWFEVGTLKVGISLYYDLLTTNMLITVTGVSLCVHLYSVVYMRTDPHLTLFLSYLSMFTCFMLVYVTGDNLLIMLVGWEGIGISSYLLIGYYSHRVSAVKSAQKAILVNRISDGMLLWGIVITHNTLGSLEYDIVLLSGSSSVSYSIVLCLILGAMGKSSQIFFHVWLADAMEGPTPVSALIHAATLVTAGIYLLIRFGALASGSELVVTIGSLTALMSGIFGLYQTDLKRVIAYSTCSQLGYMLVSIGLGSQGAEASMSHLMAHASFKAGLFLGAGVLILSGGGSQDISRYGGLSVSLSGSISYLTLIVGSLSLVGFPETSGYYTKEVILNLSYLGYRTGILSSAHSILYVSALITSSYTAKLLIQAFLYDYSGSINTSSKSQGSKLILIALSLLILDIVLKIWVGTSLINGIVLYIPWSVKSLPLGLAIAGLLSATSLNIGTGFLVFIIRFSATRWGFDQLYAKYTVGLLFDIGRKSWLSGDKGVYMIPFEVF
jgi:proton-translocating NADH-quinone oxidoreductase chain L